MLSPEARPAGRGFAARAMADDLAEDATRGSWHRY